VSIIVFRQAGASFVYSKGVALAGGLSALAVICLGQNYTQSLIPEANDGIGVSNQVALWIIGDDRWSKDIFREAFEQSITFTLCLFAAYPIVLWVESRRFKKATSRA